MSRHAQPKMITPETLRAIDREYRDLVMSLRALAALLHETPEQPHDAGWEPVLANIMDAELNQLAVLVGEITAALRMEQEIAGPTREVDLARALETAARRTGSRVLVGVSEPVPVTAHPDIVSQAMMSALSLGLRIADGRIHASARGRGGDGIVTVVVPLDEQSPHPRIDARLQLLRRIVGAEGGRVTQHKRKHELVLELSFPSVGGARHAQEA